MQIGRATTAVALLLAISFAGCTDSEPAPTAADDVGAEDGDSSIDLASEVTGPEWKVGNYFGHHVFFGASDTQGTHINTVVYDVQGTTAYLATDNKEIAELEAIFDIPILGAIEKDLSTTAFGGAWDGIPFPLFDGKTWSAKITGETDQLNNPLTRDVEYTATFNPEITTPYGVKPGFDIVGISDGEMLVKTDYMPAIEWYSEFLYFDINTEEEGDYFFRVRSMGFGEDFGEDIGGLAYVFTANEVIDHFAQTIVPNGEVTPFYQESFTVAPESTKLMGIIFAFAAGGHGEVDFVDPNGQLHRWQEATDIPTSADPNSWGTGGGNLYELPFSIGQWEYIHWNAGFVAGGGAQIWEMAEEQILF